MTFRMAAPLVVALYLANPEPADACLCGGSACQPESAGSRLFEATIMGFDTDPASGIPSRLIRLANVRAIRGQAPTVLEMQGSSCDIEFKVGSRYLVEAHEWAPGKFGASQCGITRPSDRSSGHRAYLSASAPDERPRVWGTLTTPVIDHRTFIERGGGPAIAGAVMTLIGPITRSTTTTTGGEFVFGDVPDGTYQLAVDLPAGRLDVNPPEPRAVTLRRSMSCVSLDLLARPTATVVGWVRDARGRALADVQVEMYTPPYNPFRRDFARWPAVTDGSGRFEFNHVVAGRWVAGVGVPRPDDYHQFAPAFARRPGGPREFDVEPGATIELPAIVARRVESIDVEGRVTGPEGAPIAGLDIVVSPLEAEEDSGWTFTDTDGEGRFHGQLYRGVRYRIYASGERWTSDTFELVPDGTPVALTLRPRR